MGATIFICAEFRNVGTDELIVESLSATDKLEVGSDANFVIIDTVAERFVLQIITKPEIIRLEFLNSY